MFASPKGARSASAIGRLLVSLTLGLLLLNLFAVSVFAAGGAHGTSGPAYAARTVTTPGGPATPDADCDDDDDDDECEEGGGGLPATDTAPEPGTGTNPGSPIPAVTVLLLTGLVGGAVKVAAKRTI